MATKPHHPSGEGWEWGEGSWHHVRGVLTSSEKPGLAPQTGFHFQGRSHSLAKIALWEHEGGRLSIPLSDSPGIPYAMGNPHELSWGHGKHGVSQMKTYSVINKRLPESFGRACWETWNQCRRMAEDTGRAGQYVTLKETHGQDLLCICLTLLTAEWQCRPSRVWSLDRLGSKQAGSISRKPSRATTCQRTGRAKVRVLQPLCDHVKSRRRGHREARSEWWQPCPAGFPKGSWKRPILIHYKCKLVSWEAEKVKGLEKSFSPTPASRQRNSKGKIMEKKTL